jgi:hypothetical protein
MGRFFKNHSRSVGGIIMKGIVRQLTNGIVIECSLHGKCMMNNPEVANNCSIETASKLQGTPNGTWKKTCLLSVKDHGDRCLAYPNETEVWLIDDDTSKIQQI